MISELNNPRYAPAIKILIIPRKRPAGSRDGIVRRAARYKSTRTRSKHIHTTTADRARGIFVHRIYERRFRGKDKQPFECLPCRDNFLATDVTMESGVRCLSRHPYAVYPFRSGNSMSHPRTCDFTNGTLSGRHVSAVCREEKLVRSCQRK